MFYQSTSGVCEIRSHKQKQFCRETVFFILEWVHWIILIDKFVNIMIPEKHTIIMYDNKHVVFMNNKLTNPIVCFFLTPDK